MARVGLLVVAGLAAGCSGSDPTERSLNALFDREWELRLEENPLFATSVGDRRYDDRLPSVAVADQERRVELWRGILAELQAIDRDALDRQDQINYSIFESQLKERISNFEFGTYRVPILADSGFHTGFARLPRSMPFAKRKDFENYVARLNAFPAYVDQHIANMRLGLEAGVTLPKVVLQNYDVTISTHVVDDPQQSVFWKPFESVPTGMRLETFEELRELGRPAVQAAIGGYRTFLEFMMTEYVPGARETLGASELPDGDAYYQQRIRHFTTLDHTADEIHAIGRAEVKRIRGEMEQIIRELQGGEMQVDFAEFLQFLRTDERFYAKTPEELLKQASYLAKKMDAKLPALFKTLPRLPYGVEPVPDSIAPVYTAGRYVSAPAGSHEPGYYWVNTYDLPSRTLYTLEALTLHEAVPGHHLQISLNNELTDLPNFRRYSYISAFGEGWGLYSEWLGLEAGFYQDPYSDFGRLTYEMWRACRLVVDTGIHAMGWTRQQAMDFLAANTALSLHEINTETDRYISWPGQALAYKIGEELKIRELRQRAEEALGEDFDVREFHDAVLLNGSVPLPVLEESVLAYIDEAKAAADGA